MQRLWMHRTRLLQAPAWAMLCAMAMGGCVSTETHTKALTELEAAKKTAAQQAADLDALKKKSQAQTDQLQQQLAGLQQNLDQEATQRKAAEIQAAELAKERAALEARSGELRSKLEGLEREKGQLGSELGEVRGQIAALQQKLTDESAQVSALEKDKLQLASGTTAAQGEIAKLQKRAAELEGDAARIAKEREQLKQEQSQLAATLEQERLAKEEEIARLTRTQEDLSKSLQDEIAKGNITIQQVRDRLTINMVDRVLFDSGHAQVKPAGIKVLKQVADVLKTVTDKQIRIEGHTDNVPISTKLQDRFKTNWELSTARATTVVRYLIDQGTVDRQYLSAVGYADTHPIAANDSEEGRSSNRRIEIVLYPKDLKQIASQVETGIPASR